MCGVVWCFNKTKKQTPWCVLDFLTDALSCEEQCPVPIESDGFASRKPLTSMNFRKSVGETELLLTVLTVSDYDGALVCTPRLGAFGRHAGHLQ